MIPYEQLAAALERRRAQSPATVDATRTEDTTLSGANAEPPADYEHELGDVLSDEEVS